jgi:hypothetical protein
VKIRVPKVSITSSVGGRKGTTFDKRTSRKKKKARKQRKGTIDPMKHGQNVQFFLLEKLRRPTPVEIDGALGKEHHRTKETSRTTLPCP